MGGEASQFSCCRDIRRCNACEQYAVSCPPERCASVCFGASTRPKQAMVQSVNVKEGTVGKAERYPRPDTETEEVFPGSSTGAPSRCCGCLMPAHREEILHSLPSRHRDPALLNLGERKPLETLALECKYNDSKVQKIAHLAETYDAWRPVRGDGNCYYRTVGFGILEAAVDVPSEYEEVIRSFEQ
eukprot:3133826-Amphidinium_carterae.2